MSMPMCYLGQCNTEATIVAIVVLALLMALLFVMIWFHNHKNHKPWPMKCGWVKIDGLPHFFSRKITEDEPCHFGGQRCNAVKCAKGALTSEQPVDFVGRR